MEGKTNTAVEGERQLASDSLPGKERTPVNDANSTPAGDGTSTLTAKEKLVPESEVRRQQSKLYKNINSLTKQWEDTVKRAEKAETENAEHRRKQREAEYKDAEGDPAKMSVLQMKESFYKESDATRKELADLESRLKAEQDKLAHYDEVQLENKYYTAALNHHMNFENFDNFVKKCQRFGLKTDEQIEEMAETMALTSPRKEEDSLPGADEGRTQGGGNKSIDKVRSDYIANKISRAEYEKLCKELNTKP